MLMDPWLSWRGGPTGCDSFCKSHFRAAMGLLRVHFGSSHGDCAALEDHASFSLVGCRLERPCADCSYMRIL